MTIQWEHFGVDEKDEHNNGEKSWHSADTSEVYTHVGGIESVHCERRAADAAARYGVGIWYAADAPYRVRVV